jgi:hypothetical protein
VIERINKIPILLNLAYLPESKSISSGAQYVILDSKIILDEEKSKCAGLAHEIGFGSA